MNDNNENFKILDSFSTKKEAYSYYNISPNNNGIKKLKEIAKDANFDLSIYKERRKPIKSFCLTCGKKLINEQKKFCSHSCCAKYNNSNHVVTEETRKKISLKLTKKKQNVICKICGQEICKNVEICNHSKKWFKNLEPFGFNINILGSLEIYKEYYRIKELILKEYFDNNLSPYDISQKYNYNKSCENILHLLKSFGIKIRGRSESQINARFNGKNFILINPNGKYQFKHGWHVSWDKKHIYYRSSYELDYCLLLDEKQINYEVEYFRIKYWDSEKYRYRIAIPDIFIKADNTIIEIKSRITFNKQNMIDKFKEYIKLGFNVKLLYEKKEYNFEQMLTIEENKYLIHSNI